MIRGEFEKNSSVRMIWRKLGVIEKILGMVMAEQ
jgi:hypothetical protein